jgi:hypothetical protein
MDAAAKTARERASGKAGQAAKKTELQGGQQTNSTGTEAPAIRKSPVTSGLPTIRELRRLLICCFLILLRETNKEVATPRRFGGIWP